MEKTACTTCWTGRGIFTKHCARLFQGRVVRRRILQRPGIKLMRYQELETVLLSGEVTEIALDYAELSTDHVHACRVCTRRGTRHVTDC